MDNRKEARYLKFGQFAIFFLFIGSMIFCMRAINSISIGLLLMVSFIENYSKSKSILKRGFFNSLLAAFVLAYLIQALSLFYSNNIPESQQQLILKSSLIILPKFTVQFTKRSVLPGN